MKIISKRARQRNHSTAPKQQPTGVSSSGSIIIGGYPQMTDEEIKRATDTLRELKESLDDLDKVINGCWFDLPDIDTRIGKRSKMF